MCENGSARPGRIASAPPTLKELARRIQRAPRADVQEVLNALVALGLTHRLDYNRYAP